MLNKICERAKKEEGRNNFLFFDYEGADRTKCELISRKNK